jgi:hypothetical protein
VVQPANDKVDDRRVRPVGELRGIAADGDADDGEDARADDGADAECGERNGPEGLAQRVLGQLRFADQLVDRLRSEKLGFGCEDLPGQRRTPGGEV